MYDSNVDFYTSLKTLNVFYYSEDEAHHEGN